MAGRLVEVLKGPTCISLVELSMSGLIFLVPFY